MRSEIRIVATVSIPLVVTGASIRFAWMVVKLSGHVPASDVGEINV